MTKFEMNNYFQNKVLNYCGASAAFLAPFLLIQEMCPKEGVPLCCAIGKNFCSPHVGPSDRPSPAFGLQIFPRCLRDGVHGGPMAKREKQDFPSCVEETAEVQRIAEVSSSSEELVLSQAETGGLSFAELFFGQARKVPDR